jgi:hypothetical protein
MHADAEPHPERDMVAGLTQREILSRALHALANKDAAGFESILWLAFGDEWTVLLRTLRARGIVRYSQSDDADSITDEGRRVLGALRRAGHGLEPAQNRGS